MAFDKRLMPCSFESQFNSIIFNSAIHNYKFILENYNLKEHDLNFKNVFLRHVIKDLVEKKKKGMI